MLFLLLVRIVRSDNPVYLLQVLEGVPGCKVRIAVGIVRPQFFFLFQFFRRGYISLFFRLVLFRFYLDVGVVRILVRSGFFHLFRTVTRSRFRGTLRCFGCEIIRFIRLIFNVSLLVFRLVGLSFPVGAFPDNRVRFTRLFRFFVRFVRPFFCIRFSQQSGYVGTVIFPQHAEVVQQQGGEYQFQYHVPFSFPL